MLRHLLIMSSLFLSVGLVRAQSGLWNLDFEPSKFVGQAKMPVLFVNGTNDFAYPLDSYQKTYRLVKNHTLCVTVNMPHGHQQGWAPVEIGRFVDSHLKKGPRLPGLAEMKVLVADETFVQL